MSAPADLAPADEAGVAAAVAAAHAAREPLAIEGNGSKHGLLRPVQAARLTEQFARLWSRSAADPELRLLKL